MSEAKTTSAAVPTRRFNPYPAYKYSGVEWLGAIPAHWEVRRLKFVVATPLAYGANEAAELTNPELPRYIRITDIRDDGVLRDDTFRSIPEDVAAPYLLSEGDILFARSGATVGKTFRYDPSWGVAAHAGYLIRARVHLQRADSRFVVYFTQSGIYWGWLRSSFIQSTIQNVSAERYASLFLPLPSLGEQRAIVAFLDRETARVDGLVAKKERLVELLQEKRAALITRAITKGLDPTVSMKDSGVEWLGQIPAHWTLSRLKHIATGIEQGWSPLCDNRQADEDEWGVLKVGCVNGAEFNEMENKALPSDQGPLPELEIKPGDILMSRANTRQLLGSAALVRRVRPKLLLCDKLYRIRVRPEFVVPGFLALAFSSSLSRFQFEREATGASASMQNISQQMLLDLVLPCPPPREQTQIVELVQKDTALLSRLMREVGSAIATLKELRTALISAAVTGKIDVRDEIV